MRLSNLGNIYLFLSSLFLISIGVLVIYSSSAELAFQQALYGCIGLALFFLVSKFDLHSIKKLIKPALFFVVLLLVIVAVLGIETRGSVRWIPLGFFNIQPSEFAKPVLVLLLGLFWSTHTASWMNIFKSFLWIFPVVFLIFEQPDLGSTLTVLAIWIGMLFASRISFGKVLILVLVAAVIIPSSWFFLHDYQKQRVTGFLHPGSDPLGQGYNLIQSMIAVGSGQLFGMGLGRGTQSRLQFLPEFRTDFIFASIAEEMGFVGSLIILSLYLFLLSLCLKIANETDDKFFFSIVIGVFSMLLFQIFVNIGMNIGLLPITGITLPLISYGGSSLLATLICLGLVASIARNKRTIDSD